MRVIVDTSIWSLALRRRGNVQYPEVEFLRSLIENGEDIFLIGVILQEILQGIKMSQDFEKLKEYLEPFPLLEISRADYIYAAQLKNQVSQKGIQIGTIDALIATASIMNDCYLFTSDKDFYYMEKHTKLQLLKKQ